MAKATRIKHPVPPPPPDDVKLELSMTEAQGLLTLLSAGVSVQVLVDLKLEPILQSLESIQIYRISYEFRTNATKREY